MTTTTSLITDNEHTTASEIAPLVEQMHKVAMSGKTLEVKCSRSQVKPILCMLEEQYDPLSIALNTDMGQGELFTEIFELNNVRTLAEFVVEIWMNG